ncbi:MAG: hypothetical protein WCT77_01925 [Bacteroidota bacterium]
MKMILKSTAKQGKCPVCHKMMFLDNGKLFTHGNFDTGECKGSNKKPINKKVK